MIQLIGNPKYKKCYVSGPITGIENGNKESFKNAELQLKNEGFEVINPHELHTKEQEETFTWSDFMRSDIKALCDCNFIAVLPGWEKSKGANVEVYIGQKLGMPIVEFETLKEIF